MRTDTKPKPSPWGDLDRSRRVTAVLGRKPNSMTWKQYHAAARRAPWSLDAMQARRPDATMPLFGTPRTGLTKVDRRRVERAHDDLAAGNLDREQYVAIIRPLCKPLDLLGRPTR